MREVMAFFVDFDIGPVVHLRMLGDEMKPPGCACLLDPDADELRRRDVFSRAERGRSESKIRTVNRRMDP
jgi:hypothetical protein